MCARLGPAVQRHDASLRWRIGWLRSCAICPGPASPFCSGGACRTRDVVDRFIHPDGIGGNAPVQPDSVGRARRVPAAAERSAHASSAGRSVVNMCDRRNLHRCSHDAAGAFWVSGRDRSFKMDRQKYALRDPGSSFRDLSQRRGDWICASHAVRTA